MDLFVQELGEYRLDVIENQGSAEGPRRTPGKGSRRMVKTGFQESENWEEEHTITHPGRHDTYTIVKLKLDRTIQIFPSLLIYAQLHPGADVVDNQ